MLSDSPGRYLYGLAAIAFGVCSLLWHEVSALAGLHVQAMLSYPVGAIEVLAGLAILWPRTVRFGAAALATVYGLFALVAFTYVVRIPTIYNNYGNFFEQLSLATGAVILYAWAAPLTPDRAARMARVGYYAFVACVISFAIEQWVYLKPTVSLIPRWIPPSQMFWAVATTVAFLLAGVALLTGIMSVLAARLNTAMLLGFGLLTWLPLLHANPHDFGNWSETVETFAIAGSAWIVATYAARRAAARAAVTA